MYLNTNKWIYNHVWLLNTIFSNKLQLCLVLFTYKLSNILFSTYFCASPFQPSKSSSKNSFHIFEASTRFCIGILRLAAVRQFVGPRKCLILLIAVIFNRFDWLYFLFIAGKINIFPRLKVNSKFACFILLSCKKVFAFERQVSRKKASSFKGHLLYSIRVFMLFSKSQ